jgi:hypothetical protein
LLVEELVVELETTLEVVELVDLELLLDVQEQDHKNYHYHQVHIL